MNITKEHLKRNPKRIGKAKGMDCFELVTKGGLNLVVMSQSGGGQKILGVAPHRAIARHIAQNNEPDLVIDELSKSEDMPLDAYRHLVPEWTVITERANKINE